MTAARKDRLFTLLMIAAIILLILGACQPTPAAVILVVATPSPRPTLAQLATAAPRELAVLAPTATTTPRPTPTRWPVQLLSGDAPPIGTLEPRLLTEVALLAQITPLADESGFFTPPTRSPRLNPIDGQAEAFVPSASSAIIVGYSVDGAPITARQLGDGERVILMVGGMHGGWEANTVALINDLTAHFESHPEDIRPGIRLVFVPVVNVDGLGRGRTPEGRFNTNGVDLNRNWGCDWSPEAVWRSQPVNAGTGPLSEPETAALAAFIQRLQPAAALFYHSAAGGVYAGNCRGDHGSAAMGAVLGEATGYSYGEAFSAYTVTGTAATWADGLGIPAADVELASWTAPELSRNLAGIMALQTWLTGSSEG